MSRPAAKTKTKEQPLLYLNFRPFAWAGVGLLLVVPPFLRGLFFAPDLLVTQVCLAVVFLTWLGDWLLRRERPLSLDLLDWTVLAFAAAYLFSVTAAVSLPNAVGGFLKALSYALLYFMVSRLAAGLKGLARVLALHFWAAVGVALVGILAAAGYFYYPGAFDGKVIMSTFQYKNALAAYLATASLCGLALQARRWRPVPFILYSLGQLAVLVALLCSQSRGGWVVYPLAVLAYCLFLPRPLLYRSLYAFFLNLGAAALVTRSFLPAAMAQHGSVALRTLLLGAAALAVVHLAVHFGELLLRRHARERVRRAVAIGAVLYAVLVAVLYLALAGQAAPSVAGVILPSPLLARAQAIGGYEPNFQLRLVYDRDALRIFKDYPLLGAGGGAWNALYHRYQDGLYFTTEVHNHFLQVAVEAGILGLAAFCLAWFAFARHLVRLRRSLGREEEEERWPLVWAAGVAALALGGHSFFDFNLSLPALAYTLWSLWAVVRAQEAPGSVEGARLNRRRKAQASANDAPFYTALLSFPARLARHRGLQVAVAAGLALVLLYPSLAFYRAGRLGAEAARAMEAKELVRARNLYEAAHRLDPYTATYAADLAQVLTALGLAENRQEDLARARELARRAALAEPYNPRVRAALSLVYLLQGYVTDAVAEAEAVVYANPWDAGAWEQLGRAYVGGAQYYRRFGYDKEARELLEKALDLPDRVVAQANRRRAGSPWQGPALRITPALLLARGQAAYLLGRPGEAAASLETAYRDKALAREAAPWLAAALVKDGRPAEAEAILAVYPGARPEYERLLSGGQARP